MTAHDGTTDEYNRLVWQCRRGMRELDELLHGFMVTRYHALDATGVGAEAHPDTDLGGTGSDGEREDAGDPDHGDDEGEHAEGDDEHGVEPARPDGRVADLLEGRHALDELAGGDVADGLDDGGPEDVGVERRADEEGPADDRVLSEGEPFFVLADFDAYCVAQDAVDELYLRPEEWIRRAVLNTVGMGVFSSDRSIREYAERIWRIKPVM